MHNQIRGCGLGMVNIIQTFCLSELSISPRVQRGLDNRGWTVYLEVSASITSTFAQTLDRTYSCTATIDRSRCRVEEIRF
jgi:hypothetical protein